MFVLNLHLAYIDGIEPSQVLGLHASFRVRPLVMSFHAQATLECTCFSVTLNHALTMSLTAIRPPPA